MRYLSLSPPVITAGVACVAAGAVGVTSLVKGDPAAAFVRASRVLLLGATVAVLLVTLVGTTAPTGRVNLVPGASILAVVENTADPRNAVENLLGNVLLFVPLGFLAVCGFGMRLVTVVIAAAMLSGLIELTQLGMGQHWVDIDDLLLNTVGATVGALCARGLRSLVRRADRGGVR